MREKRQNNLLEELQIIDADILPSRKRGSSPPPVISGGSFQRADWGVGEWKNHRARPQPSTPPEMGRSHNVYPVVLWDGRDTSPNPSAKIKVIKKKKITQGLKNQGRTKRVPGEKEMWRLNTAWHPGWDPRIGKVEEASSKIQTKSTVH